jgi:hypothetical protein
MTQSEVLITAFSPRLPISFPSYPTNTLSASSVDTDLSLGSTSNNQSLDSEDSGNDTSTVKELCRKLSPDMNSEEIVADALTPLRMALVDQVMEEF